MAKWFGLFGGREANGTGSGNGGADKKITVDTHRCPQNHACPSIKVCPVGALSQEGFHAPTVDMDTCIRCGKCVKFCPMHAISLGFLGGGDGDGHGRAFDPRHLHH